MVQLGYKLSSEEFSARALVDLAVQAEAVGFDFALISDHFHPWTTTQGQSPFVWATLGAIVQATSRLRIGTAVTCPTMRVHPAIVAQAAATTAALADGRFFFGVGSGENLNEHVVGRGWPSPEVRLAMFEEAIDVVQRLWTGVEQRIQGRHYTVDRARLFTLPDRSPPLMVAASKPGAAALAGRVGDAMINTEVDPELTAAFRSAGGEGKPCYVEMTVCWAEDERRARRTAHEMWSLAGLPGLLFTELPTPELFEAAMKPVDEETVAQSVVCGPDPSRYLEKIREAASSGYTHVCLHQVGPEQQPFFDFCAREILPALAG